jgi:hypothetical protein
MLLKNNHSSLFFIIKKVSYITMFNYIAIFFFISRAIFGDVEFLYLGATLGLLVLFTQLIEQRSLPFLAVVFITIVLISYILTFVNNGFEKGILFVPLTLSHIGVAWRMSTHGVNLNFSKTIFFGSIVYFFYSIGIAGLNPGEIFANSRNYVSVYFLNTVSILYISIYLSEDVSISKARILVPAALVFLVSTLSIGTSGIATSFVFLVLILLIVSKNVYKYILGGLGVLAASFFQDWNSFLSFLEVFPLFSQDSELLEKMTYAQLTQDNPRYTIWSEYLSSMNAVRLLSGISLNETFYGFSNYHSSFVLLHARIGMYAFIFLFLFLYLLIKVFRVSKILATCLFVILLRSLSDTSIMAGSSFDFVLFYLLFFSLSNKEGFLRSSHRYFSKKAG